MNQSPLEGSYEVDVFLQRSDGECTPLGKSTAVLTSEGLLVVQRDPELTQLHGVAHVCVDF